MTTLSTPIGHGGVAVQPAQYRQIAFVDHAVTDLDHLVGALPSGVAVVVIPPKENALRRMADALSGFRNLEAIHIFAHGADGRIWLGGSELNGDILNRSAGLVARWRVSLSDSADILIYGCDVAATATGRAFVSRVADITGANVAAATEKFGALELGGSWELAFRTGPLATILLLDADSAYRGVFTHFRSASLQWETVSGNTVAFHMQASFRASYPWTVTPAVGAIESVNGSLDFGDSTSPAPVFIKILSINTTTDVLVGELVTSTGDAVQHTYAAAGNYEASWEGSARIASNDPFANLSWRTVTTVNAGSANHAPVSSLAPVVQIADNTIAQFQIPAFDQDGDTLTYRFGRYDEFISGSVANNTPVAPIGATISSTGLVTWDVRDVGGANVAAGENYTMTIVVEDGHTKTPVDVLVQIVSTSTNQAPAFDSVPPDTTVYVGTPQDFALTALDPNGDAVTIQALNPPVGMTTVYHADDKELHVHFDPSLGQVGQSYVVTFQVVDSGGLTADRPVTFTVQETNTAPTLQTNVGAIVNEGAVVTLANTNLSVTDTQQSSALLVYSLTDLPDHGTLLRGGVALTLSDTFTQKDIDDGLIAYDHDGSVTTADAFLFDVSDGQGASLGTTSFSITVNDAPTAVALTNTVALINENTATASHIKVADILVTDDGLGTNTLGLTGADAAFFEIVGTSLYLKAGTVLDFETKASYAVAVTADDSSVGVTPDATVPYTLAVGNVNEGHTPLEIFLLAIGGVIGGAITVSGNQAPATVALTNITTAINESTSTPTHIKVADIVVTDDGVGTNTLGLTGADAAFFEIVGTSLYLKAGINLDFEAKASYAVALTVDDTSIGSTPDATSAAYTLAVADVNEAPTTVGLSSTIVSIDENTATTSRIKVADIVVADDALGANTLSVIGADAAFFEIVGNALYLKAGTNLDFETKASYAVAVTVDDTSTGSTPDATSATYTLAVADLDETPIFTGTPDDDTFAAQPGSTIIDGLAGVDTVIFDFALTDATVSYVGNKVIVDGPGSSHTVLTGFEIFKFTDGTVDNNDGNWLVDDLFYYSQNHDVWSAHADADAHYAQSGWHENRDPNAFFSTAVYLSANPDVRAAGVDPLKHFDESGWKEGRIPSINFDPVAYLAANPDVKAAYVDPLAHFLQFGASEGRQPIAPDALVNERGFDYVYYLLNNPDVAAARVDPFQHFETIGWKEGRDPNSLFDTRGYLAAYADVKAAGVNPLDHYFEFGWVEGRDPSLGFDTTSYLAAYPDVNAAHIAPLTQFLQYGIGENRSPFADAIWG